MVEPSTNVGQSGLDVLDLYSNPEFAARRLHNRDASVQMQGIRRLARVFMDDPDSILQELVNAAVELCGADSAGISVERTGGGGAGFYEWIATAGIYEHFLHAMLPRQPSACGVCLERGRAQILRVSQRFFDLLGIEAAIVTDGILLPWQVDGMRGTIWILAHGRREAFDLNDCQMMEMLADFAALAVRKQKQQTTALRRAASAAASGVANDLAHRINNPLQSIVNQIYIAAIGLEAGDARMLAESLTEPISHLSAIVRKQLSQSTTAIN